VSVKRYDPRDLGEADNGCFVKHDDYLAIQQKLTFAEGRANRAERQFAEFKDTEDGQNIDRVIELRKVVERLREKCGLTHPIDFERFMEGGAS
jgi:hypothetical protein